MEFADSETIDKSTWAELVKQIQSLQEHQHQWVFRALGRWDPKGDPRKVPITSSFDTAWKRRVDVASDHPPPAGTRKLYEAWILYEFKREAHNYLAQLPKKENFLEWMALGRHYGMPSRLVDFTYSFFVAAYFALSQRDGKDDGCMIALDLTWMKSDWETRLAKDKSDEARLGKGTSDSTGLHDSFHNPDVFHKFAFEKAETYAVVVNPLRRNPRLANQKGCFLCPGNIEVDADENLAQTLSGKPDAKRLIRLPAGLRTEAMRALAEMNLSQATLYPDLIGWAESRRDLVYRDIPDDRFRKELEIAIGKTPRI
jgi:hypothetical protein